MEGGGGKREERVRKKQLTEVVRARVHVVGSIKALGEVLQQHKQTIQSVSASPSSSIERGTMKGGRKREREGRDVELTLA